jgi:hypothetical protein
MAFSCVNITTSRFFEQVALSYPRKPAMFTQVIGVLITRNQKTKVASNSL